MLGTPSSLTGISAAELCGFHGRHHVPANASLVVAGDCGADALAAVARHSGRFRRAEAELYGLPVDQPEWVAERYRALDTTAVAGALERHLNLDDLRVTVGVPVAR